MTVQHQDRQPPNERAAYPGALLYIKHITETVAEGDLDAYDVAILTALAVQFADWDTGRNARPSLATLAAAAGTSRAVAKRRLKKLEQFGWLNREERERRPSVITLSTGRSEPRVTATPGQTDPTLGSERPHLGSQRPGGRVGATPDLLQEPTPENYSKNQEESGGVPTVVPRASAAPEREAEPAPPLRFDGDVEEWGATPPPDEAMRLARGLVQYLEATYLETGHRSTDLAQLLAALLGSERWDADSIRAEVKRSLPAVRGRFRGRESRAVSALLGDMAEAGYGTRPGRSPEQRPANTIAGSASVLAFLQEAQDECEARDALLYSQGVA